LSSQFFCIFHDFESQELPDTVIHWVNLNHKFQSEWRFGLPLSGIYGPSLSFFRPRPLLTLEKSIARVGVEIALLTIEMKADIFAFEEAPE